MQHATCTTSCLSRCCMRADVVIDRPLLLALIFAKCWDQAWALQLAIMSVRNLAWLEGGHTHSWSGKDRQGYWPTKLRRPHSTSFYLAEKQGLGPLTAFYHLQEVLCNHHSVGEVWFGGFSLFLQLRIVGI